MKKLAFILLFVPAMAFGFECGNICDMMGGHCVNGVCVIGGSWTPTPTPVPTPKPTTTPTPTGAPIVCPPCPTCPQCPVSTIIDIPLIMNDGVSRWYRFIRVQ